MGHFSHGHIQCKSLESVGRDDQQFLLLIQDCFLTQHVLEPTRGNVLDLVFSPENELVEKFTICEPFGSSYHKHIHFSIKLQTEITGEKRWRGHFNKDKYKQVRTYLSSINWTDLM